MPHRLIALLAVLTALVPVAVVAAGCGSDDLTSVSAAQAADSTRSAESAKVSFKMTMSGMGLPLPMTVTGQGVTATGEPKMDVTFDFGQLTQLAGAGSDGKTRFLLDGKRLFVDPPAIQGLKLPGGAQWVTADLGTVLQSLGVDPAGLGELVRLSPEQQFDALKAAGSVKTIGEEEIDGVKVAHLKGTVKMSDYLAALPADRRERAQKAIDELKKLPGADRQDLDAPAPIELWVDGDKRVRRMIQKTSLPGQGSVPAGTYALTMDLKDFGTKLDIAAPAAGKVWDATDAMSQALKSAAVRGGGTTTG
jgi:hypothetical protein